MSIQVLVVVDPLDEETFEAGPWRCPQWPLPIFGWMPVRGGVGGASGLLEIFTVVLGMVTWMNFGHVGRTWMKGVLSLERGLEMWPGRATSLPRPWLRCSLKVLRAA